jgi:hypothetical protein
MTQDKYLKLCEQLNKDPVPEEIPPSLEDLPFIAQVALVIFNNLGDRVFPEIGYIGKDYTNLPILMQIYDIDNRDKDLLIDILGWLDSRAIKKSSDRLKKEYDKIKRKSSAGK